MSTLTHFSEAGFQQDVLESETPVVVDFYADWCGPCRMMAPVVEQLAGEYTGSVRFGKLDTDANPDIAMRFQVMGIPTLGLFKGGQMVDRMVGFPGPAGVKAWIDKALQKAAVA